MTETKCCKPFSRGTTLLLVWSALMSFVLLSMAANLISLTFNFSNSYTVYTPASHWVDQWFFAWKVSCYYCWKLSISSCIFIHFDIICHATVWLDNTWSWLTSSYMFISKWMCIATVSWWWNMCFIELTESHLWLTARWVGAHPVGQHDIPH